MIVFSMLIFGILKSIISCVGLPVDFGSLIPSKSPDITNIKDNISPNGIIRKYFGAGLRVSQGPHSLIVVVKKNKVAGHEMQGYTLGIDVEPTELESKFVDSLPYNFAPIDEASILSKPRIHEARINPSRETGDHHGERSEQIATLADSHLSKSQHCGSPFGVALGPQLVC